MGGCRCYFRQCHVNHARFPGIPFFRFPIKESERFAKWRQYSKMEHILQFSEVRRGNTSICARHFRMECFMNYKMDRLVPTAVPTIMRLSNTQALDFELDMENGVLVTLEMTKFKHLIPPIGFECPLSLVNDKILLEKLNELQTQEYSGNINTAGVEYMAPDTPLQYEELTAKEHGKTLVNSVEILETIQVAAPNAKRQGETDEQSPSTSVTKSKKFKLRDTGLSESNLKSGISILPLQLENSNGNGHEINIVDTDQMENTIELLDTGGEIFLTGESFINDNASSDGINHIEIIEIHEADNSLDCELQSSNDSDVVIAQLKEDKEVDSSTSNKLLQMQRKISQFKKKIHDYDILRVKLSVLETENNKLKNASKENKDIKKQLLSLKMENKCIKNTLKDYESLKHKLHEYTEENKRLREEIAGIKNIKSELLSRTEERNELKKLLETLKNTQSKEITFEEEQYLEMEKESSDYMVKETELKLNKKVLKDSESQIKDGKANLVGIKNENTEQSFNNSQNNFDILQSDHRFRKSDYNSLQQKHIKLNEKHLQLQALQSQEATVSTSLENKSNSGVSSNSLTKAQLFNGVKRYLSASMVSFLRMDMFGSPEREWKSDERQVAVDILRLGEMVYMYFTDEWRFRLPALRDVRNWLNYSRQMIEDEEDI